MQSMAATGFSSAACRSWAAVVARSRAPARHVAGVPCCPVASTSAAVFPLGARGRLLPTPLLLPESSSRAMSRRTVVVAAAAPAAEGSGQQGEEDGAGIARRVQLGAMIVVWYLFNIYFNIYNKLLLKALPFPYTITTFQFASGSFFIFLMWITNLHPKPRLSMATYAKILPMACIHMLGNVFTNISLGKVPVSFTHTVKAMEPFFSVLLSVLLLGETPSLVVLLSLVPIVGGVALASLTEVSFNWIGFWSAMVSNLLNQSRNVYSKKLLGDEEETLDDINLFSILTVMSFLLSLPLMLFVEGIKFTPSYLQSTGISLQELCVRAALTGFCFHSYQQVSYSILARVSPVTHSVANCLKRVVVIVSSVLFFRTPISPINAFGTSVALAGVFLYSRLKRSKPEAA